jgi:hypothetical protein
MKRLILCVVTVSLVSALGVFAQGGGGGMGGGQGMGQAPLPGPVKEVENAYNNIKNYITAAADQFPEDKYTWAPTPQVRSWARLMGHIVDDQNGACWAMAGLPAAPARLETEDTPNSGANKMTKAQLKQALADAFGVCAKAFGVVTEANMLERQGNRSKLGALWANTSHTNEHYGNVVTYMRLQNMVPPSTAGRKPM